MAEMTRLANPTTGGPIHVDVKDSRAYHPSVERQRRTFLTIEARGAFTRSATDHALATLSPTARPPTRPSRLTPLGRSIQSGGAGSTSPPATTSRIAASPAMSPSVGSALDIVPRGIEAPNAARSRAISCTGPPSGGTWVIGTARSALHEPGRLPYAEHNPTAEAGTGAACYVG